MPFNHGSAIADAREKYLVGAPPLFIIDKWGEFLKDKGGNITSQSGEDGFFAAIFERIGMKNRWCFEVGSADGLHLSNTWSLRQTGWQSVLIESDDELYASLCRNTDGESPTPHRVHHLIRPKDLDRILYTLNAPRNLDLGVIDVDGQDWHILDGLKLFRPRVLMVEYSSNGVGPVPKLGCAGQAGICEISDLAKSKGYRPVLSVGVNLICVDGSEL